MSTCLIFAGPVTNTKYFDGAILSNVTKFNFFCRFETIRICIRLLWRSKDKFFSDNLLLFAVRL